VAIACWHGVGRFCYTQGTKYPQQLKFYYYFVHSNFASDSIMTMTHLWVLQRMLLNERTLAKFSDIQDYGKRNAVEYVRIYNTAPKDASTLDFRC
jgi:hypothetical protein